jgi:hypothetical protein
MPLPTSVSRRGLLGRLLAWAGAGAILPSLFPGPARGGATPGYGIDTPTTMPEGPLNRTQGRLFEGVIGSRFRIVPDPQSAPPPKILFDPRAKHPSAASHRKSHTQQAAAPILVPDPMGLPRMVVLTSVTQSKTTAMPGRKWPAPMPRFSLIFRDVNGPALPQETYRVEHAQLGVFPLFLVPIGPKRGEVYYQAIFA